MLLFAAVATFLFSLRGAPVGIVELRTDGDHYRYRSTQFFSATAPKRRVQQASYVLGASRAPVSLALLTEPLRPGCRDVFEELTQREGTLCVDALAAHQTRGTALAHPFVATYRDGALQSLALDVSRFTRIERARELHPRDPFADGIPVSGAGSVLALENGRGRDSAPLPTALDQLARAIHANAGDDENCLALSERLVRAAQQSGWSARVVTGVYSEIDSAFAHPHAWARVTIDGRDCDADPTLLVPVRAATHLELGPDADATVIRLFAGERRLERR